MITSNLKSIKPHIGLDQFSNILETNLVSYYSWQFLKIGAWNDVSINDENFYGDDLSRLRPVNDPSYTDGTVWEGMRKDWIWESDVNYSDITGGIQSPLAVSGLQVSGVLYTGNYIINYPQGRIIFDSPIPTTASVKIQHSFRNVQVISTNSDLWEQVQQESLNSNSQFLNASGDWDIQSQHRVQLPLVAIEVDANGYSNGHEIGNTALEVTRDVLFFVLTEDRPQRNNLMDIIANQSDADIWLFDSNTAASSGQVPLDYRGSKVTNAIYPNLVSETGFRWKRARMEDAQIINIGKVREGLYESIVKTSFTSVI